MGLSPKYHAEAKIEEERKKKEIYEKRNQDFRDVKVKIGRFGITVYSTNQDSFNKILFKARATCLVIALFNDEEILEKTLYYERLNLFWDKEEDFFVLNDVDTYKVIKP